MSIIMFQDGVLFADRLIQTESGVPVEASKLLLSSCGCVAMAVVGIRLRPEQSQMLIDQLTAAIRLAEVGGDDDALFSFKRPQKLPKAAWTQFIAMSRNSVYTFAGASNAGRLDITQPDPLFPSFFGSGKEELGVLQRLGFTGYDAIGRVYKYNTYCGAVIDCYNQADLKEFEHDSDAE